MVINIDDKGEVWYSVTSIKELRQIFGEKNIDINQDNISLVINGIDDFLDDQVLEDQPFDRKVIDGLLETNDLETID